MLRKSSDFLNFKLGAQDGEIGHLKDYYFDDESWTVRYLVADTGNWLPGRQVLLSPFAFKDAHDSEKILKFELTRKQIEDSPSIDADKPVTRQHETDYAKYYGWPMYWYGPVLWGPTPYPVYDRTQLDPQTAARLPREETADPHLRSMAEVTGYRLEALDGGIGHIDDFIVNLQDWSIVYLVIDTRNWWPGKHVLISPTWIQQISWMDAGAHVDLDRETIRNAPEYDSSVPITRAYEGQLFEYYGRNAYWLKDAA